MSSYNNKFDNYLDYIYYLLSFFYYSSDKINAHLFHANVCGANTDFVFNFFNDSVRKESLKRDVFDELGSDISISKIIICQRDDTYNRDIINLLNDIYGSQATIIGAQYHALPYFTFTKDNEEYHIAVETTSKFIIDGITTILQFCIGNTKSELEELLKKRYQCVKINMGGTEI